MTLEEKYQAARLNQDHSILDEPRDGKQVDLEENIAEVTLEKLRAAGKVKQCKACGKEIVFLKTNTARAMPVIATTVRIDDILFDRTRHASHFADCPKANEFRKGKR